MRTTHGINLCLIFNLLSFLVAERIVHRRNIHENDEILSFQSSLFGDLTPRNALQDETGMKNIGKWIAECPLKRREPNLSLIKRGLVFDQSCALKDISRPQKKEETCRPMLQGFCHKEYLIPNTSTMTLSILTRVDCSVERTMRLLSWYNFNIDISCHGDSPSHLNICEEQNSLSYPMHGNTEYTYIFIEVIQPYLIPNLRIHLVSECVFLFNCKQLAGRKPFLFPFKLRHWQFKREINFW